MPDWSEAILPIVVATTVVLLPGFCVCLMLRLRGVLLLGMSAPISVALIGGSAVIAGQVGIAFSWAVVAAATLVVLLAAAALRRLLPPPAAFTRRRTVAVAIAAIAATVVAGSIAFGDVASPQLVSQTYDGVFHLNAIARILDTGDASSFHLYRVTRPGDGIEFYPAAWHSIAALVAQLTGCTVPVAASAAWLAGTGPIAGLGSALLVGTLPIAHRNATLAAVTAVLGSSVTAAAPYVLLRWGVLYPTGLAYALLPAGLALAVLILRSLGHREWRVVAGYVGLGGSWAVASGFAHPRSLISFVLLAAPIVVAAALRWFIVGVGTPERRRRTAVIGAGALVAVVAAAAVGSAAVLRYFGAAERPISDRLNGGPATARQSIGDSVLQAVTFAPPSGAGESTLPVTVVVAAALVAGVIVAFTRPGARWLVGAFVLVVVTYSLAAGSNDDLAKIATGFWYKDKYRLFALLGVLAPALLALTADAIERIVRRRLPRSIRLGRLVPAAVVAIVLVVGWTGPTLTSMRSAVAIDYAIGPSKDGRLLDSDEYALLEELPSLIPDTSAVVVGDPWNGSTLSWAVGGRESLFPHLTGLWDPDRVTVAQRLDAIGSDPEVCAALDRLNAHYLLSSPGRLWGGDPQASFFDAVDRAAGQPGFAEIARRGDAVLYEIDECR